MKRGMTIEYDRFVGLPINSVDLFTPDKWPGHNWLGKLLASVRTEIST